MNYYWTECPKCACQLTIHFIDNADALTGSLRRWSSDRATNDGRALAIPRSEVGADGGFQTACVCGQAIAVDPTRVEHATTERPA